jgi:hypothetical protein
MHNISWSCPRACTYSLLWSLSTRRPVNNHGCKQSVSGSERCGGEPPSLPTSEDSGLRSKVPLAKVMKGTRMRTWLLAWVSAVRETRMVTWPRLTLATAYGRAWSRGEVAGEHSPASWLTLLVQRCHTRFYAKTKYSSYAWSMINCSTHMAKNAHR